MIWLSLFRLGKYCSTVPEQKTGSLAPHPVHENSQTAGQRDEGLPVAAALCQFHGPGIQPGPLPDPGK